MDTELQTTLDELGKRIAALEAQVADLRKRTPEIDEDTLVAITAAIAAYLGVKAKVKAIHYAPSNRWSTAGRRAVQRHDVK